MPYHTKMPKKRSNTAPRTFLLILFGTQQLLPSIMTRTDSTKSQAGNPWQATEECMIQRGSQWKVSPTIISSNLFFGVAGELNCLGAAFRIASMIC